MTQQPTGCRFLRSLYKDLAEQGVKIETDVRAQAALMSGVVVAGSLTGSLLALCLGSSWASALVGGDFPAQFRRLRLGLVIGVLAVLDRACRMAWLVDRWCVSGICCRIYFSGRCRAGLVGRYAGLAAKLVDWLVYTADPCAELIDYRVGVVIRHWICRQLV